MCCDVATSHVLNRFELIMHLTNASKRDARSSVELAVFDEDVCRIRFWRNSIIAIVYYPSAESDVVGIDCVATISVLQITKISNTPLKVRE